jgi:hypothetical protein
MLCIVLMMDFVAGPDLDRASGGYKADHEDQMPSKFWRSAKWQFGFQTVDRALVDYVV